MAKQVSEGQHGPLDSSSLSFFGVDKPNVDILTIKKPEDNDSDSFIIRLQELSGLNTHFKMYLPFEITGAVITNLVEEDIMEIDAANPLELDISPHQTLTIRVSKTGLNTIIKKPREGYLYVFDRKIMPTIFGNIIIIGKITIEVGAYGENGIDRVEFYIDGVLKDTDTEYPYEWLWNEFAFGKYEIKVIAYDNAGNIARDEIRVIIFNLGRGK